MEARLTPSNTAPIAVADQYEVHQGDTLDVTAPGVLANDSDADQDPLTAELVNGPSNALGFVLNPDGSFSYQPLAGFTGADQFSYQAFDGIDYSDIVSVVLNVTNQAPDAVADLYSIHHDEILDLPANGVLANDSDPDADALTAVLANGPSNANAFELNDDGSFSYQPLEGFSGTDSFTYQAYDGADYSAVVTVNIDVTNQAPVGVDDTYYADAGVQLNVDEVAGVLANDFDQDGDLLSAVLETSTSNGYLTLNSDGSFYYTPDSSFQGTDTFTYRIFDGATVSALLTAAIEVQQAPPNPITFTVNTTSELPDLVNGDGSAAINAAGDISLRSAIEEANALAGNARFIINFAPALANQTISLTSALEDLNKNITINGAGATNLTVQRDTTAGNFRIFHILRGKSVSISNLIIKNGRAFGTDDDEWGGAIFNAGTLTLSNAHLLDNEAEWGGGAIYNDWHVDNTRAQLFITDTRLEGNSAGWHGGAIYNYGQTSISGSEISYNYAGAAGGGIFNGSAGILRIDSSTIRNNEAENGGGGIANYTVTGSLTMLNSSLEWNYVLAPFGRGGGLYNATGAVAGASFRNVDVNNNHVDGNQGKGGGIYIASGTVTLHTCEIVGNSCGLQGGGNGSYKEPLGGAFLHLINPTIGLGQDMV